MFKKGRHLESVVRPASKLHLAVLVVEGEPGDVDLTRGLEDAGGYVGAASHICHHNIGRERSVKLLIRAEKKIINVFQIFYGQLGLPYDISQSQFIKGSGLASDQKSQIEEASTSI